MAAEESEAADEVGVAMPLDAMLRESAAVARDCLDTVQVLSEAMLRAVAEQQRAQRELLAETARLCRGLLDGFPAQGDQEERR